MSTTAVAPRKTPAKPAPASPREPELTEQTAAGVLERVVIQGDLKDLTAAERAAYYARVCQSVGLNPLTRPFDYITFQGRLTLYARKDATDQLRSLRRVSLSIVSRETAGDVYVVLARATLPDGRTDESIGAVPLGGLRGADLANAYMKCESKAKRRVTLSICGLGLLDETELETISGPAVVSAPPAPALPAPSAKPKKAAPADGAECWARLVAKDKALAEAGLCEEGELLDHVQHQAHEAGFHAPPERWAGPAIDLAISEVKGFEASRKNNPHEWFRAWVDELGEEALKHVRQSATGAGWNPDWSTWALANVKIARGWLRAWLEQQGNEEGGEEA